VRLPALRVLPKLQAPEANILPVMDSIHNAFEADPVAADPTTADSLTLKLTGTPFLNGLDL
jgi:hypothetical protein